VSSYLVVVQAPAYPVRAGVFATESAFAEHLRMLRDRLGKRFDRLLLAAPRISDADYESRKESLSHVDEAEERIHFVPLHDVESGRLRFWRSDARRVWRTLREAVRSAELVHSGIGDDLWRPAMIFANAAAKLEKRPVLWHVDIDFRNDTEMYRETGVWGRRAYLLNRFVYDPMKLAQLHLAPKMFDLVLLKSASMVKDVGRGAPHVRNFYDTVHSAQQVLDPDSAAHRMGWMKDASVPLKLAFFGRFVEYKGLDRSIEAVRIAREKSGRDIRLELIGQGEEKGRLEAQIRERNLQDAVTIVPPVPYGQELFSRIRQSHVQIATPLCEDTPRAAFDAFAQGMPIVAFDIRYYEDLAQESGAVATARWPDPEALADVIVALDTDRNRLASMSEHALSFARDNTQEIWLDRRIQWTLDMLASFS